MQEELSDGFQGRISISGWLFIYCLSRAILEPVYFTYTFAKLPEPAEKLFEVCFAISGLAAVYFIYKRSSTAFKAIGLDLTFRAFFTCCVFLRLSLHPLHIGNSTAAHLIAALITAGIQWAIALAWFLYLKTSKRVRITFGRNLLSNI